jgi:hypothetical protein
MLILSTIWNELKTPDGYPVDWYGYATNQVTHLAMGFAFVCILSGLHFAMFGEFAQKGALWFTAAMVYAVYELSSQGWNGKDTVEDWVFFSIYGAVPPIAMFSEIEVGNPELLVNSQIAAPVIGVVVAHLIGGILARVYLKVRSTK